MHLILPNVNAWLLLAQMLKMLSKEVSTNTHTLHVPLSRLSKYM